VVLVAGAALWVLALVSAPVLPAWMAAPFYALGSLICHQLPERSFHLGGAQLPVCARCLGIYLGGATAFGATMVAPRSLQVRQRGWFSARVLLLLGAMPTGVTVLLEWSGRWSGSNVERAWAGAPLGVAVALVLATAAATLHYERCARRPVESSPPPRHI
jgi:uncharacterized membrane protein